MQVENQYTRLETQTSDSVDSFVILNCFFSPLHISFVFHCKLDILYKTTDNEISVVILGDEHSFPSAGPFMQGGVRVSLGKMGWL